MRAISTLLFLFECFSLPHTEKACVDLKIHSDSILVNKANPNATLTFSVISCTNQNLILYNLDSRILMPLIDEDEFCKEDVAAGVALYIYNESNEIIFIEAPLIPDSIDYKPMPKEKLEALQQQSKIEFIKSTKVFKPRQVVDLKKQIKLADYQLERGTYFLQLLYFSGEYITNYVNPDQVVKDKRIHNASVYQGCMKSNRVKLLVN